MGERWFRTSSGREVLLTGVHIQSFSRGLLMGRPDLIRSRVLARLADEARRIFPGRSGVYVAPCEGPADAYPLWIYACEFHSVEPVRPEADFSALIVVWFADDLGRPIPEFVAERIGPIDWESFAVDGWI